VSAGRCAPGGVADIVAAEPLEHERGGVPSAVLAGHEADASLDRAVAGEKLRVSAAAAASVRRRRRRRRPNCVKGGARARAGASARGFPPAPALQGLVTTGGAAGPFQGRTPARERGERAPDRAPSRGRVAALAVRRHARRVEEWARADGEMTGREARSASEKKATTSPPAGRTELVADWFHFVTREVGPLVVSLFFPSPAGLRGRRARPDAP
jgi:hypothetical protein